MPCLFATHGIWNWTENISLGTKNVDNEFNVQYVNNKEASIR